MARSLTLLEIEESHLTSKLARGKLSKDGMKELPRCLSERGLNLLVLLIMHMERGVTQEYILLYLSLFVSLLKAPLQCRLHTHIMVAWTKHINKTIHYCITVLLNIIVFVCLCFGHTLRGGVNHFKCTCSVLFCLLYYFVCIVDISLTEEYYSSKCYPDLRCGAFRTWVNHQLVTLYTLYSNYCIDSVDQLLILFTWRSSN